MKKINLPVISLLFIANLNLIACAPGPFVRYKSPAISGTLYTNNEPAKGIHVYLSIDSNDKYCTKYIDESITDDNGQFSIASVKEKMNYTPLMTYYLDEWTLCVDEAGTRKAIYSNNRYAQGGAINSVHLQCDLKKIAKNSLPCQSPLLKNQ